MSTFFNRIWKIRIVCQFHLQIWKMFCFFTCTGEKFVHKYLELQHVSRFQSQISSHRKSIPIWFSKYHGWWCGRAESFIFNHSFIGQHQPHTHLIHRIIKSWLLIKVLIETIQMTQKSILIALKTRKTSGLSTLKYVFLIEQKELQETKELATA